VTRTLISLEQVAERLGCSPATLRYWRQMDEGPPSFRVGRRVVYDEQALDRWIDEQIATTGTGRRQRPEPRAKVRAREWAEGNGIGASE